MQTEREREAQEFRSQGTQRAQEIRARADRDVTVVVAEATSKSEQTRGEGDCRAQPHLRGGLRQGSGLLRFYRSMQAYETGLRQGDTRLVIKPDSEFFRYFADPSGKQRGAAGLPAANAPPAAAPAAPR